MDNYIILELARGRNKVPAYTPFIAPGVSASPWAVTSKENTAAVARRRGVARQANREDIPQSIPTQDRLLYHLRFLIAADLACDWSGFGCLASLLNRLSIAMSISIVGSASAASPYGRLVREFLGERSLRLHEITRPNFPGDFLSVRNLALKLRAMAEHPLVNAVTDDRPARAELLNQHKKKEADAASAAAAASAKGPLADRSSPTATRGVGAGSISLAPGRALVPGVTTPIGRLHRRKIDGESVNPACVSGFPFFFFSTLAFLSRWGLRLSPSPPRMPRMSILMWDSLYSCAEGVTLMPAEERKRISPRRLTRTPRRPNVKVRIGLRP